MNRPVLAIVAVAALAASCSQPEAGRPTPDGGQPTGAPTSAQPPQQGDKLPPRPAELPIGEVDVCGLLTDAQRSELKVARADEREYEGQAECAFTVEADSRNIEVAFLLDTREGADVWLSGGRNVDAEADTIDGYGVARFWFKGTTGADCNTAVDIADGQHLQVSLLLPGQKWTQEKLCETTDRFAAAALSTLRAG